MRMCKNHRQSNDCPVYSKEERITTVAWRAEAGKVVPRRGPDARCPVAVGRPARPATVRALPGAAPRRVVCHHTSLEPATAIILSPLFRRCGRANVRHLAVAGPGPDVAQSDRAKGRREGDVADRDFLSTGLGSPRRAAARWPNSNVGWLTDGGRLGLAHGGAAPLTPEAFSRRVLLRVRPDTVIQPLAAWPTTRSRVVLAARLRRCRPSGAVREPVLR